MGYILYVDERLTPGTDSFNEAKKLAEQYIKTKSSLRIESFIAPAPSQTSVRKKAKPEELDSKLKKARVEFRGGVEISAEECKMYSDMVEILEGRKKPPKAEGLKEITNMQKKEFLLTAKAMSGFCQSKTEEHYLKVVRLTHDKDIRTGRVSSNPYKQKFKFVQDNVPDSSGGSWVTQGGPEGPCGIVQPSRFEAESMKDSKLIFWKYVARKAITNPQGFALPGRSCKDLDEDQYVYDWRSKEHSLGCDYIEFSPI